MPNGPLSIQLSRDKRVGLPPLSLELPPNHSFVQLGPRVGATQGAHLVVARTEFMGHLWRLNPALWETTKGLRFDAYMATYRLHFDSASSPTPRYPADGGPATFVSSGVWDTHYKHPNRVDPLGEDFDTQIDMAANFAPFLWERKGRSVRPREGLFSITLVTRESFFEKEERAGRSKKENRYDWQE